MAKPTYYEMLRDPRWQKMRLEVMRRDDFKCRECGDDKTTLNVHHTYYAKGRKPWEYEADSLVTLCQPCHELVTEMTAIVQRTIGSLTGYGLDQVMGYARAVAVLEQWHGLGPEGDTAERNTQRLVLDGYHQTIGAAAAFGLTEDDIFAALGDGNSIGWKEYTEAAMKRQKLTASERIQGAITEFCGE